MRGFPMAVGESIADMVEFLEEDQNPNVCWVDQYVAICLMSVLPLERKLMVWFCIIAKLVMREVMVWLFMNHVLP